MLRRFTKFYYCIYCFLKKLKFSHVSHCPCKRKSLGQVLQKSGLKSLAKVSHVGQSQTFCQTFHCYSEKSWKKSPDFNRDFLPDFLFGLKNLANEPDFLSGFLQDFLPDYLPRPPLLSNDYRSPAASGQNHRRLHHDVVPCKAVQRIIF